MKQQETAVLVVGGSLVGLSAAMLLGAQGVRAVLVEPHLGSSPHPRAIGYTPRTMEIFAEAGIARAIPQIPVGFSLKRRRVESLAGKWFEESAWTPEKEGAPREAAVEHSPFSGAAIAQDRLEPILRDRARELGADLRLGTELVRFEQDADGVTALLREKGGREYTLRASYVIAADGNQSGVRKALGIPRKGPGLLQTMRSVLFRAPLDAYLESGVSQFEIDQPGLDAFLTTYGDGRWVLMFKDDVERDRETLVACVKKAIGREDVPVEIITTGRWELTALVAERFSQGRVFLVGDAAHTLPPTRGGYGANTGIHDVHNLAWKLARLLDGKAPPKLLESYDAERRPIAWCRLEQTFARPDYAKLGRGFADGVEILDEIAMELGQIARSDAILGAGDELPSAARPDVWRGQPGTRAPFVRIDGARSTLDAFGKSFVMVAADAAWRDAAKNARLDWLEAKDAVQSAFGIGASGAALVRPDGIVAWRTTVASTETLPGVLARVGA